MDDDSPFGHLMKFHICHRGMSFVSEKKVDEFMMYRFQMLFKKADVERHFACTCVVVSCESSAKGFHTILHFLDLSPEDAKLLQSTTRGYGMRCAHSNDI